MKIVALAQINRFPKIKLERINGYILNICPNDKKNLAIDSFVGFRTRGYESTIF